MKSKERLSLINELVHANGYSTVEELLAELEFGAGGEGGICRECRATTDIEPDVMDGWCGACDEHAVISIYCLLEVI